MNKICILGSINMDLVYHIKNMPKEGETLLSKGFERNPGGKGANQAVAAKRCGGNVSIFAMVGNDGNGTLLKKELEKEGIDTKGVLIHNELATGTAIIMVNDRGNNSIIVDSGANMGISVEDIKHRSDEIKKNNIIIAQFETPEEVTLEAFKIAKDEEQVTILNPAPARSISDELLKLTDIIIPNETEIEIITGIKVVDLESAKEAGEKLLNKGVKYVIITLGEKGAAIISNDRQALIPSFKVNAVDTTAAGDSFIGALSAKIDVDKLCFDEIVKGVAFGNKVSSIAVTRRGAQSSIPYIEEIEI